MELNTENVNDEVPNVAVETNKTTFSSDEDAEDDDTGRVKWSRQFDFFLSLVGYCVGLGNIWRFPYFCNRNGGGAFLIPYLIFLILVGLPLFFLEVSAGQFSGRGAMHVWSVCPLFKGLGYTMSGVSLLTSFYFNLIIAWAFYYLVISFAPVLPWITCNNWWNTELCTTWDKTNQSTAGILKNTDDRTSYNESFKTELREIYTSLVGNDSVKDSRMTSNVSVSAVEEFWQYNTLRVSTGLNDMGTIQWHLVLALFGAWALVFLCLIKGVRSIGKVVYVTALLPYVLITVILIRAVTLPGAQQGIIYYVRPEFSRLADPQVWLEAMLQMFYSLGVTWGGLHTMASYNKFSNNCYRDAVIVTFLSEGTSFYAGFAIFSVLGFMADNLGVPVSKVVRAGPGLGFIAYPEALAKLPLQQLWSVIFFIMLITVGIDSQFGTMETIITAVVDTFPKQLQRRRVWVTIIACILLFLLAFVFASQGGIYVFVLIDWYVATFSLQVVGILECVIFGWIYGANRFSTDIEMMLGKKPPVFMKILWCFVTPTLIFTCLVITILQITPPTYGDYNYPKYGVVIGWFLAVVTIVPVPICAIKELVMAKGSLKERFRACLKPEPVWGPVSIRHRVQYTAPELKNSWKNNLKIYKW